MMGVISPKWVFDFKLPVLPFLSIRSPDSSLKFILTRTKHIKRIGHHKIYFIYIIICGYSIN